MEIVVESECGWVEWSGVEKEKNEGKCTKTKSGMKQKMREKERKKGRYSISVCLK